MMTQINDESKFTMIIKHFKRKDKTVNIEDYRPILNIEEPPKEIDEIVQRINENDTQMINDDNERVRIIRKLVKKKNFKQIQIKGALEYIRIGIKLFTSIHDIIIYMQNLIN